MPPWGVYIPHFGQISIKMSVLGVLYPYRCTDGVKYGMEEGTLSPLLHANDKGTWPPKLKFLWRFDQNEEYKRPTGAYPLLDFHLNLLIVSASGDVRSPPPCQISPHQCNVSPLQGENLKIGLWVN